MIQKYLSLVKFSHTLFALPFAMVGFFYGLKDAAHPLDPIKLVYVLVCMVTARSAAMAFNRYIDRRYDEQNPRTAVREIPSGAIKPQQALAFVVFNCAIFVLAAWLINPLCFALSPIALAVVLGYSYTKRFTALCHLVLGIGLGLAPVGAYLAVTEVFQPHIVLLGFVVTGWVGGFDVIYALQDDDFDRSQKLHSIPAALGRNGALWVSNLLHIAAAALLFAFGKMAGGGTLFWTGYAIFSALLVYQHLLVKPNDLSRVNLAFFTTNGVASVVFGALVVADLYFRF